MLVKLFFTLLFIALSLQANSQSFLGGKMTVSWTIDGDDIEITVSGQTTGYVAVGFATKDDQMVQSDAYAGWVDSKGKATIGDYWITAREEGCPGVCPDTSQGGSNDVTLVSGSESGGKTTLTFRRPLDTKDSKDLAIVDNGKPTFVIVAMGENDKIEDHDDNEDSGSIDFFAGSSSTQKTTKVATRTAAATSAVATTKASKTKSSKTSSSPTSSSKSKTNSQSFLGGKIMVSWMIDGKDIEITVSGQTTGYVAVGFATKDDQMVQSDAYAGWVDSKGKATIGDYWITAREEGCPGVCPDTSQGGSNDVTLVSGSESGGKTTLTFRRPLDTKDSKDLAIVDNGKPTFVIVAMGENDKIEDHDDNEDSGSINFFSGASSSSSSSSSSESTGNSTSGNNTFALLGGSIVLSWTVDSTSITLTMQGKTSGYVAVGFASTSGSMIDADAVVGSVQGGKVTLGDYYMTARQEGCPGVCPDTQQGGSSDVTLVSGTSENGLTTVTFKRLLDTGDSKDVAIVDNGSPTSIIVAMGGCSDVCDHGGDRDAADINFFTGEAGIVAIDSDEDAQDRIDNHGVLMWVGFGPLFTAGIACGVLFKRVPYVKRVWLVGHTFFMYSGLILIFASLALGVEYVTKVGHDHLDDEDDHDLRVHKQMGVAVVVIAAVVPMIGHMVMSLQGGGFVDSIITKLLAVFHKLLGYATIVIAYVEIFYGLDANDSSDKYWVLIAVWTGIAGAFLIFCFIVFLVDTVLSFLPNSKNDKYEGKAGGVDI